MNEIIKLNSIGYAPYDKEGYKLYECNRCKTLRRGHSIILNVDKFGKVISQVCWGRLCTNKMPSGFLLDNKDLLYQMVPIPGYMYYYCQFCKKYINADIGHKSFINNLPFCCVSCAEEYNELY